MRFTQRSQLCGFFLSARYVHLSARGVKLKPHTYFFVEKGNTFF